jgi:hypothetical protein
MVVVNRLKNLECLTFLSVRRRSEIMLLMMKMMMIAVRTSVSQDQVTATLCTKELFLSTQCIYSSPRLTDGQPCGRGGKDTGVNTIHLAGSAGSHTSQPDLTAGCRFSDKTEYFYAFIL